MEGVTPLWCAAAANYLEIVRFLVDRGADVNRTTITNSTALRAACFDGHEEVCSVLFKSPLLNPRSVYLHGLPCRLMSLDFKSSCVLLSHY